MRHKPSRGHRAGTAALVLAALLTGAALPALAQRSTDALRKDAADLYKAQEDDQQDRLTGDASEATGLPMEGDPPQRDLDADDFDRETNRALTGEGVEGESGRLMRDSYAARPTVTVQPDEAWLRPAARTLANPESQTGDLVTGTEFGECDPSEWGTGGTRIVGCKERRIRPVETCETPLNIRVNATHKFACEREEPKFLQKCDRVLEVTCAEVSENCARDGFSLASLTTDLKHEWDGNTLAIGSPGNNYYRGDCAVFDSVAMFEITDLDLVQEFRLIRVQFDDYAQVEINGVRLYTGPVSGSGQLRVGQQPYDCSSETTTRTCYRSVVYVGARYAGQCERSTSHKKTLDLDARPYIKLGLNTIRFRTIVGGAGELYTKWRVSGRCCLEFLETWRKEC